MNCTKDKMFGCICPECAAGWLAYTRYRRKERGDALSDGTITIQHGTETGYINYACRCEECRAAHSEYQGQKTKARKERSVPEHVHGTYNGYNNYGCRCVLCGDARSEYVRERQASRRAGK